MKKGTEKLENKEVSSGRTTMAEIVRMQEIEDNPLTQEDLEMFEMFDRKGWNGEQRRAYMIELAKKKLAANSTEAD